MLAAAVVLSEENPVYDDMVVKFVEQFELIVGALNEQGLYDPEDGFFYDRLITDTGLVTSVKVQTVAGLIPLLPVVNVPPRTAEQAARLGKLFARARERRQREDAVGYVRADRERRSASISLLDPGELRLALRSFFDEDAFLSPYGVRSLSKRYQGNPYTLPGQFGATIDYQPAESVTPMYGGNSNWRGPVWLPVNYLLIRSLVGFHRLLGDEYTLEYPTGSGRELTLGEIAQDLSDRLVGIWRRGPDGRRPVYGGVSKLQNDPAWRDNLLFFEHFHGDDGAGLGAMHQTGWTALVVDLILDPPGAPRIGPLVAERVEHVTSLG
jgi:hypothetical protein